MRRCIIHIGHPKTATTYLQHCLHRNAALFARHNYWLPDAFEQFGFYDLGPLAEQGRVMSGNLAPLHEVMMNGPGQTMAPMQEYLFGAPGMPPDCDVILSCELFFYYWRATIRLVGMAQARGLRAELVAYLPRQDHAAISSYLQNVRYHGYHQGVVDFLVHDSFIAYCRYLVILDRLRAALPDTPIIVRSFHTPFLHQGDILSDFLEAVNCRVDPADCERPGGRSNQGLTLEHYELLRVASLLGREDAAALLRDDEAALTRKDRARTAGHYYREPVRRYLEHNMLPENRLLLERHMPFATADERAYWETLEPPGTEAAPDPALRRALWHRAFA